MNWMTALLALIPTILLVVQGSSCLSRTSAPLYVRRFGVLCSMLAGLSFVLCLLLASGTLVLSSEFGIVMGQGPWARVGIALLLIGSALGSAMGLYVCYLEAGRQTRLSWVLGLGAGVGFLATVPLLFPLNPSDADLFHIYAYDLWWPPLLIYVSACLVESALSILRLHHRPVRLWIAAALIGSLALLALSQPQFGDPTSAVLWKTCLLLLPVSISVVTWLFFRIPRERLTRVQGWIRQGLTALPAGIGLLSGMAWIWGIPLSPIMTSWPWLLWLSWPLLVGLVTPYQLYRAWRAGRIDWQSLPRPTFQQSIMLMAIGVLALGFVALVSFVSLDRTIALGGFVMTWILLVEAIARGPLSHLLQRLIAWQQWSDIGIRVSNIGKCLGSWLGSLLSVPSMPVLLGKALVGMTILVALNELPNAGKTLIQPFKVLALPERTDLGKSSAEREAAGQAILEQVVNNLGLLQQELRQEVILSLQPDSEDGGGQKKFELMSVGDSTNVSAALSKSPDLEISGVKIPLGLLLTPIQGPIRRLLGVRAINASVQVEQRGYSLLASSDAGETWKLTALSDDRTFPSVPVSLASSDTGESRKLTVSPDDRSSPPVPISPIARLAAELAFHIIKSDEMFAPALTKSWTAFSPFKEGLTEWRKFETNQDYPALSDAIAHFRAATQADPGFAYAHYRLGLALQKDGQPGMAVKAFHASLKADPSLIPAHIAWASTLYDFERTSYLGEVGSPLDFPSQNERIEKARDLWLEVLRMPGRGDSVANLGSAYYGLCRQAFREGLRQARLNSPHPDMTPEQWHYMAYYYCKRAEVLYASLATAQHTNPEVKKGEAYVLHTLGVILARFQRPKEDFEDDQPGWKCWTDTDRKLYSRESLQYFMRALDVLPDDYRLRCYAARTAYALDKRSRLLERLEADALAHLNLANAHRRLAKVCAAIEQMSVAGGRQENETYRRYQQRCQVEEAEKKPPKSVQHYQGALHEYNEVMQRDPMNIEALTGYALAVWERLIHAGHSPELRGWIESYAVQALSHARKAAALSLSPPDNIMAALVRSTLGKALLAQGSSKLAIEKLQEAVKLVPNHPAFHEIHWVLAQAYLCAASSGNGAGLREEEVQPLEKRAAELLEDIRQEEETREFQLYSKRSGGLNSPWGSLICKPSFGVESMPDAPFTLKAGWSSTSPVAR